MNRLRKFLKSNSLDVPYYLWMILAFTIVAYLFDYRVAITESVIFVIMLSLYIRAKYKKKRVIFKYINSLELDLKNSTFHTLYDFNIPVSIIDTDGTIEWCNESFSKIICTDNVRNLPITDYIPSFDINKITLDSDSDGKFKYDVSHNSRSYVIYADSIYQNRTHDDSYYIVLYWYDNTEHEMLKAKHYNDAFVSCMIVIDNYDDVMQSTPNADKPQLTAFMEEALDSVAQECNGILNKYEKDRFFLYIQKNHLNKMISNNFQFIETFKTLLCGNKVAPTLSVGIGTDGESLAQNDSYAYSAIDMALGRGGDQVVVKDNDKYHFYGGKSIEVEKRTRVKARVVSQAMKEIIMSSEQIIIMGHRYADVDVLGSALGLYAIITALGKKSKILLDTYNQTVERFISKYEDEYKDVFVKKGYANEFVTPNTLIFVVDTQKYSMVEEPALLDVSKNVIVIDHHRKSNDFIKDYLITYHEPYASSASELVTEFLHYIDEAELNKSQAEALYAGIYMDTKNFTFKTGVRTFEAASYLKRRGVDTIEVKKLFQINLNAFVKKWAIIENATTYKNKVAIALCVKNDNDMQTIVAQAADEMLNITDISSSFVICDMGDNKIIVSARSFGDINVQVITEKLGGGGHMTIAGAQLTDTTPEEVLDKLKKILDDYVK